MPKHVKFIHNSEFEPIKGFIRQTLEELDYQVTLPTVKKLLADKLEVVENLCLIISQSSSKNQSKNQEDVENDRSCVMSLGDMQ